jgi:hypothetical protein
MDVRGSRGFDKTLGALVEVRPERRDRLQLAAPATFFPLGAHRCVRVPRIRPVCRWCFGGASKESKSIRKTLEVVGKLKLHYAHPRNHEVGPDGKTLSERVAANEEIVPG